MTEGNQKDKRRAQIARRPQQGAGAIDGRPGAVAISRSIDAKISGLQRRIDSATAFGMQRGYSLLPLTFVTGQLRGGGFARRLRLHPLSPRMHNSGPDDVVIMHEADTSKIAERMIQLGIVQPAPPSILPVDHVFPVTQVVPGTLDRRVGTLDFEFLGTSYSVVFAEVGAKYYRPGVNVPTDHHMVHLLRNRMERPSLGAHLVGLTYLRVADRVRGESMGPNDKTDANAAVSHASLRPVMSVSPLPTDQESAAALAGRRNTLARWRERADRKKTAQIMEGRLRMGARRAARSVATASAIGTTEPPAAMQFIKHAAQFPTDDEAIESVMKAIAEEGRPETVGAVERNVLLAVWNRQVSGRPTPPDHADTLERLHTAIPRCDWPEPYLGQRSHALELEARNRYRSHVDRASAGLEPGCQVPPEAVCPPELKTQRQRSAGKVVALETASRRRDGQAATPELVSSARPAADRPAPPAPGVSSRSTESAGEGVPPRLLAASSAFDSMPGALPSPLPARVNPTSLGSDRPCEFDGQRLRRPVAEPNSAVCIPPTRSVTESLLPMQTASAENGVPAVWLDSDFDERRAPGRRPSIEPVASLEPARNNRDAPMTRNELHGR